MSNGNNKQDSPKNLPDSPAECAECDNSLSTTIRLGWMWQGAPIINGGECELIISRNPADSGQIIKFEKNIIKLENIPKDRFFTLKIKPNDMPAYQIMCAAPLLLQHQQQKTNEENSVPEYTFSYFPESHSPTNSLSLLQTKLYALGINPGNTLGNFTKKTAWAIAWFQKNIIHREPHLATGYPDTETQEAIHKCSSNARAGNVIFDPKHLVGEQKDFNFALLPADEHPYRHSEADSSSNTTLQRGWFQDQSLTIDKPSACDHDANINYTTEGQGAVVYNSTSQAIMESHKTPSLTAVLHSDMAHLGESNYLNTVNLPQPVTWLQDNLRELGINMGPKPQAHSNASSAGEAYVKKADYKDRTIQNDTPGYYGRTTEWAVREFQYYARMQHVAQEQNSEDFKDSHYPDRLIPAESSNILPEVPTGAFTLATEKVLSSWLDNRLRCPVVAFATSNGAGAGKTAKEAPVSTNLKRRIIAGCDNIWRCNEPKDKNGKPDSAPRIFVLDLTKGLWADYDIDQDKGFTVEYDNTASKGLVAVAGDNMNYDAKNDFYHSYGPSSRPKGFMGGDHCMQHCKIRTWPGAPEKPTKDTEAEDTIFQILKYTFEAECCGYYDCLNFYDNGVASLPLLHHTLIRPKSYASGGETTNQWPGVLAYLKEKDDASGALKKVYDNLATNVGLSTTQPSGTGGLKNAGIQLRHVDGQDYTMKLWDEKITNWQADGEDVDFINEECNYFRNWHSFWRHLCAFRSSKELHSTLYGLAKMHLKDILTIKIQAPAKKSDETEVKEFNIGQVFRSIPALAMLYRAYINLPSTCTGDLAKAQLWDAYNYSQKKYAKNQNSEYPSVTQLESGSKADNLFQGLLLEGMNKYWMPDAKGDTRRLNPIAQKSLNKIYNQYIKADVPNVQGIQELNL